MAKLLDGTRIYGSAIVDTDLTVSGNLTVGGKSLARRVSKPATPTGASGDTIGDYCIDGVNLYICNATYTTGSPSIWVKFSGTTSWS
jgi:hypothetical protein